LDEFSDRTIDIAEPLAAITEVAYKGHSDSDEAKADLVAAVAATRNEQQSSTAEHRILRHLLELAAAEDPLVGNASELFAMCSNLSEPPTESAISQVLRQYGFKNRSHRKHGEAPRHRYWLSKAELQDVVDRWATDEPETQEEPKIEGGAGDRDCVAR
jgi:hypothetical protein